MSEEITEGPSFFHSARSMGRLIVVVIIGIVVGIVAAFVTPWQMALLIGWIACGGLLVLWVLVALWPKDAAMTRMTATREDDSRAAAHLLLVSAALISLVGTALDLVKAGQTSGRGKLALTAVAVLTVVVSWLVVHTLFMLRYAHEYYTPPIGGVDFKSDDPPDYHDFAYLSFTVGMTFQVSDTDLQSNALRRTALRHALVAYLFGAVILGVTVNVVAGLVS